MRVLLTGATGFIGTQVLQRLLEEGYAVTTLVVPETLQQLANSAHVRVVLGGLNEERPLAHAARDAEIVLHLAGKIQGHSAGDLREVNVRGTERLLAACAANGVRRFVFVSSASAYRLALCRAQLPITETSCLGPVGSTSYRDYGNSKIEAERLVLRSHHKHGLEYSILRPTIAYGPSENKTPGFTERLLDKILGSARALQMGNRRWRHMQWVHVADLANAILTAGIDPGARNQIFTVAGTELFNLADLAEMMLEIARPASIIRLARQSQGPLRSPYLVYDIGKAQSLLNYRPMMDLRAGLSQVFDHMQRKGWFLHARALSARR